VSGPRVTYGPFPVSMLVTDVQPHDEWTSDSDTVVIHLVEMLHATDDEPARVRLHGRIIRGLGRGQKIRTWSFVPDQRLEIVRHPK
jgi:hypothetical protein